MKTSIKVNSSNFYKNFLLLFIPKKNICLNNKLKLESDLKFILSLSL